MKFAHEWPRAALALGLIAGLLVGCDHSTKRTSMTLPPDLARVTTVCIGRYLVDMPEVFEPTQATYAQLYYGLDKNFRTVEISVPALVGGQSAFEAIVASRTQDLISSFHSSSTSRNMLDSDRHLEDGSRLLRAYASGDSTTTFKSELYSRKGPATALYTRNVYEHENGDAVETSLVNIANATSPIVSGKPTGRGTCIGPLLVDAAQDAEILHPSFRSQKYPDVTISFDMNSLVAESDGGLFARVDAKAGMIAKLALHSDTLRKDKMMIGGRAAEEILETGKDHGKVVRSFTAETVLSAPSTFAQPLIAVDMAMGGQVNDQYRDASLSDDQALLLWDNIIKSIRPRPGAL